MELNQLDVIAVCLALLTVLAVMHMLVKLFVWKTAPPVDVKAHQHSALGCSTPIFKQKANIFDGDVENGTEGKDWSGRRASAYKFERAATGKVKIGECQPDGRFVSVHNSSRLQAANMQHWRLCRKIDQYIEMTFVFPKHFRLLPQATCKVFAKDFESEKAPTDLVFERGSWGTGKTIQTSLLRPDGTVMAVFSERSETNENN